MTFAADRANDQRLLGIEELLRQINNGEFSPSAAGALLDAWEEKIVRLLRRSKVVLAHPRQHVYSSDAGYPMPLDDKYRRRNRHSMFLQAKHQNLATYHALKSTAGKRALEELRDKGQGTRAIIFIPRPNNADIEMIELENGEAGEPFKPLSITLVLDNYDGHYICPQTDYPTADEPQIIRDKLLQNVQVLSLAKDETREILYVGDDGRWFEIDEEQRDHRLVPFHKNIVEEDILFSGSKQFGLSNVAASPVVLLNGMRVIFDQSSAVYPVNLESKPRSQYSSAKSLSNALQIVQNSVYLPWPDRELTKVAQRAIYSLENTHSEILTGVHHLNNPEIPVGKSKPLSDLHPNAKLYLIAHGHANFPVFSINGDGSNGGTFTPEQLAEWIENDGLRKDHRELELLVCNAALSIGTELEIAEREKVRKKWNRIKNSDIPESEKETQRKKLDKELQAIGSRPSEFSSSDQVIPLAAQFTQALKDRGYNKIRVISYEGTISQSFGENNPYEPYDYQLEADERFRGRGQVWVMIDGKDKPGKNYQKTWL
jgi:hypothetical protein